MTSSSKKADSEANKIKVGVVGVGYLGKFHAEKYTHLPEVTLVGVVDSSQTQVEKIAEQFNTEAFTNYQDLIGKVDAVSIVVPTPAHFAISRDFLMNGIDVLIEKPITTTLEEADELIRIAQNQGCLIQVGHLERFNPAVLALDGVLKVPRFIESHRLSVFKERGTDVSVVLDLMIHDIDIILNFVKSKVQSIHAVGSSVISQHVDIANARLEFANGCVANVTASRISTKNERKIRLFQKDTYISVDFASSEITIIQPDETAKEQVVPGMGMKRLNFAKADALESEIKSFIKAVSNRQDPEVTGQMGRDALKIALSIMQQIQSSNERLNR